MDSPYHGHGIFKNFVFSTQKYTKCVQSQYDPVQFFNYKVTYITKALREISNFEHCNAKLNFCYWMKTNMQSIRTIDIIKFDFIINIATLKYIVTLIMFIYDTNIKLF